MNQGKDTKGKLTLTLVPPQITKDIALVREYGTMKYGNADNWKSVDVVDYLNAMYRHLLEIVNGDLKSKDDESGIEHYKHIACNVAFICELLKGDSK